MDKRMNKMDAETLQQFLAFRKRAGRVPAKKGKGSYSRKNFKKGVQANDEFLRNETGRTQSQIGYFRDYC